MNELGYDPDLVEVQLAHMDKDRLRAIHNRAEDIGKRRAMMKIWAYYLDGLRRGADAHGAGCERVGPRCIA